MQDVPSTLCNHCIVDTLICAKLANASDSPQCILPQDAAIVHNAQRKCYDRIQRSTPLVVYMFHRVSLISPRLCTAKPPPSWSRESQ